MGTMAENDIASDSDTSSVLGLFESEEQISGSPQVLANISSVLERSIKKNEKSLRILKKKDAVTIFHGTRAPALSIKEYIERIFKYANCSTSCFVIAYIYVERFAQQKDVYLTSLNIHRLLITSVMVAAKFMDSVSCNNAYYAKVGGVSRAEMNRMEMKFLFNLEFRLQVTPEIFKSYYLMFEREDVDGNRNNHPVTGRLNQGWTNRAPKIADNICRAM